MRRDGCCSRAGFKAALALLVLALCFLFSAEAADLSVTITSEPDPASVQSNLTYTITVSNAGPTAATGVLLTNELSPGQVLAASGGFACPEPGPVAWWKGENNAEDAAGTHHGMLVGGVTYAPGKVGEAFNLDGAGGYVSFPDAPALNPSSFTIEGWFQPAAVDGLYILVSKTFGDSSSVNDSFAIYINAAQLSALVPNGEGGFDFVTANSALVAGQWYHIGYTLDDLADTHTLYIDGEVAATGTTLAPLPYDSNPVLIGADLEAGAHSFFYAGLADEVTIYNYALATEQLQQIHAADSAGKCVGSTGFFLGDLPAESSTNIILRVVPTLCSGSLTNIVSVSANEEDPNSQNNRTTNAVMVVDLTPPLLVCPPDKTVDCGTAWDFDEPAGSDSCGEVTVTILTTVTNTFEFCGQTLEATRTWQATDEEGNTAECSQTVSVIDATPPLLMCAADKTVDCGTAWDFDEPSAEDLCGGVMLVVESTVTNAVEFCLEAVRSWTATDDCGNTAQCAQRVTLLDTTNPTIVCLADKTIECETPWSFDMPMATDDCGEVMLSVLNTVTNALGEGAFEIVRTWQASDACGNTAECSQTVSGMDTTEPIITCVADKTVECGLEWDFDPPMATDDCGEPLVTILSTETNIAGFCGGTFEATRTWQAADAAGNTADCSQTVTVTDTLAPTIQCAADRLAPGGEEWSFDEPIASDQCGGSSFNLAIVSTVTNDLPAGGYVATRTWEASDLCGNAATCSQSVTVEEAAMTTLTITRAAQSGMVVVCWPIGSVSNVLEFSTNLTSTSSWMIVQEPPVESGPDYCVTTATEGIRKFFRLRQVP